MKPRPCSPASRPVPAACRLLDLAGALGLLVLLAPLLAAIALLIRLVDGRPVLFTQTRAGLHGRPFRILKFRTLPVAPHPADAPGAAATRLGRWLRRWGLDELPQLWNVVRGEMRLVGPRPTLCEQVARYGPFERRRLAVPPGLTGWAQIHGRNALAWPARIRLDVWYVAHRSLWLDLWILARTPFALLDATGVYGPEGRNGDFASPASPSGATAPVTSPRRAS